MVWQQAKKVITSESCSSTGHQGGAPDVLLPLDFFTFSEVVLTFPALLLISLVNPSWAARFVFSNALIQELSPILLFRRHPLCCFCDPLCCFCVPLCWSVCPFCWFCDPFCCFWSTTKQQSGNLQSPNARGGTECWFCIWVESTFLVVQKPRINDSCRPTFLVV